MHPILHLAPAAAASLVAAAWQGAALATLVALALRLLPNLSATVRSAIWTAVLALVVLLPFAHAFNATTPSTTHAAPIHIAPFWSLALVAIWAAFSLVRATQLAASAIHLRRLSRRAIPVETAPELAELLRAGRRSAQLCLSNEVDRPSVAGFFTPRILLPATLLARLSPAELEQIILHEMEHLKRHDDWVNLAQKLALAIFPLNPALLFIERRLCLERELACDDGVLRATNARKAYATCLANLAEHSLVRHSASLALAAWSRRSELATRVHRILFRPANPMPRRQTAAATSLLAFVLLGGAATLAHAPQLVSFAPQAEPTLAQVPEPLTAPAPLNVAWPAANAPHATLVNAILPASQAASVHTTKLHRATQHRTHNTPTFDQAVAAPALPGPFRAVETSATVDQPSQADQQQANNQQTETVVVLTRWEYIPAQPQPDSGDQPQPARSPSHPSRVSHSAATYAAVPTPGGWILFEL